MEIKYLFFYDESFHTRKITMSYVGNSEYSDSFVATCVGWEKNRHEEIIEKYSKLEKEYKTFFSTNELKSAVVKYRFYKKGIASFRREHNSLYQKFFDLLNSGVIVSFTVMSKLEYVIRQIIFSEYGINRESEKMIYSITKAIWLYHPNNVIEALFNNHNKFIEELKKFLLLKIKENEKLSHKVLENDMFNVFLAILNSSRFLNLSFDWKYLVPFDGLKLLVNELGSSINEVELTIDNEGDIDIESNTLKAAKCVGFIEATEVDSKSEIGVRISDMLCGFIGKMIRALENAYAYSDDNDFTNLKLIDEDWFKINKEQFDLYKSVAKFIFEINNNYYTAYTGIYSDDLISLFALLRYVASYSDYESYKKTSKRNHSINLNNLTCEMIKETYKKF